MRGPRPSILGILHAGGTKISYYMQWRCSPVLAHLGVLPNHVRLRYGPRRASRGDSSARARDGDEPASVPLASLLPSYTSHNDTRTHTPPLVSPYGLIGGVRNRHRVM